MDIQQYIEEIKSKLSIVDYISKFVSLKKAGRNYIGLCPFHIEKTPSFSVSPEKNIFFCFGCRTGGDIVAFVTKFEGLTFKEAVENLGDLAGLQPPIWQEGKSDIDNQDMFELLKKVSSFFFENLQQEKSAQAYLKKRGINQDTINRFQLGYAPSNSELLLNLLKSQQIDFSRAVYLGILSKDGSGKYYSYFRDRIIFPIRNHRGFVVGFGGRALNNEQMPKYLNSPDNSIFHKGKNLFALYECRNSITKANSVIVVEGYMDTISLHQKGVENVVASLGTAFSMEQAEIVHKYVSTIYLSYDNDSAGKKATLRALELLLPTEIPCRVIELPDPYKDPDEFIQNTSLEAYKECIEKAKPSLNYLWDQIKLSIKPDDSISLNDGLDKMIRYLSNIKNNLIVESMIKKISVDCNLLPNTIQTRMQALKRGNIIYKDAYQNKILSNKGNILDKKRERELLKALLEQPDLYLDKIFNEIQEEDFSEPLHRLLFQKIQENYQNLGYIQLRDLFDRIDEKDCYALISELMIIDNSFIENGRNEVFLINDTSINQILESTRNAKKKQYRKLLLTRISKAVKEEDYETSRILREELKRIVG